MASNPPPFQVEDTIDDDFFDNLVNSDDDTDFTRKTYVATDGNDSDDAKLFANLSINDDDGVNTVDIGNERNDALVSSDSGFLDKVASESINVAVNELVRESSLSDSNNVVGNEIGVVGVKEVDSSERAASNEIGSYSDLFGVVDGVNANDPFENLVAGVETIHASAVVENMTKYVQNENVVADQNVNGEDLNFFASVETIHAYDVVENVTNYAQNENVVADHNVNGEDLTSSEYWESQYPGWKYDSNTGQWYQVETSDAITSVPLNTNSTVSSNLESSVLSNSGMLDSVVHEPINVVGNELVLESGMSDRNVVSNNVVGNETGSYSDLFGVVDGVKDVDPFENLVAGVESVHVSAVVENVNETVVADCNVNGEDITSSQYWESQYPGWKYDSSTEQWYQIESSDAVTSVVSSVSSNSCLLDNVVYEQINVEKSGNELVLSGLSEFEKLVCEDSLPDTNVVSNHGVGNETRVLGVKAVDWSVFHADSSEQAAGNGFGSYPEIFGGAENVNANDPFENLVGDSSSNGLQVTGAVVENSTDHVQNDNVEDLTSSQYWESQYPGWAYDSNTGQWYQVESSDAATSVPLNTDSTLTSNLEFSERITDVSYLQQGLQSAAGSVTETSTIQNVTSWVAQSAAGGSVAEMSTVQDVTRWNQVTRVVDSTETAKDWNQVSEVGVDTVDGQIEWNQASQDNNGYPQNMVFDSQYPGWYYDTIVQEWRTLESYNASLAQSNTAQIQDQTHHAEYASTNVYSQYNVQNNNNQTTSDGYGQGSSFVSQDFGKQAQEQNWVGPGNSLNHLASMWKPDAVVTSKSMSLYNASHITDSHGGQNFSVTGRSEQNSTHHGANGSYYKNVNQVQSNFFVPSQSQGFVVGDNSSQHISDSRINRNEQKHTAYGNYSHQNSFTFSQHEFQNAPTSYAHASGRLSAGRPAHALVSFGFGGKLIVMKHNSQNTLGNSPTVLNLAEVVSVNTDASNHGVGTCNYFQALGRHSVPGPLTGGSVGTKELNKWIDERIANPGSLDMDYRKAEVLKLLLSLLKIACQYYGKLRSPYGSDAASKETDAPESAVAKLFALAKDNVTQSSHYGAQCLQEMPSEGQMQVAATKVQSLLVSGRKKEALQCAQDGQLWGPAVVLAAQLGDQFYVETIKQMALRQLVAGSPLRTLCLLIAGQPADVFPVDSTTSSSMPGYANMSQQPVQIGASGMLDDWEENLAVITANRTKDDELVLIHLGDCLWKERSNIIAAHICYLVAEASFEPYSDSARLCLIGADHWKSPRTYASPEAIQRTEIYEYSKTLGNSQFVLLPFQPYKLVYAHMLAEVGRISDALKYAQVVLKSLKTGRSPEVEILKHLASSLEERIKTYQQGGFSTTLAPSKFVGKLLNLFDNTAARVVGGLPPHVPTAAGNVQGAENHYQHTGSKVSSSQSTFAMLPLVPSQSTESINEWASDQGANYTRSVSEPNIGRNPRQSQTNSEKEASLVESKASTSRLGRFGFGSQLLQKTVGLVLKPRQGKQAKLGDTNKFYYDEKLKRWVEEGAESPAEETAPPPPPTTAVFQNGAPEYNLKSAMQNEASHFNGSPEFKSPSPLDNQSGIPPLPTTMNQYSARGRMGVRSRYVDTFNKGGGNTTNLFQSPSASNIKPTNAAKPTFFMPTTPISTPEQQPVDGTPSNGMQEDTYSNTYENSPPSSLSESSQSHTPPSSSMTMQRFASMNNISNKEVTNNGPFSVNSRRTASWSGFNNSSTPHIGEVKHGREVLGIEPSPVMAIDAPLGHSRTNSGSFGNDLQQVEL